MTKRHLDDALKVLAHVAFGTITPLLLVKLPWLHSDVQKALIASTWGYNFARIFK